MIALLWSRIGGYVMAVLAVVGALAGVYLKGRSSGAAAVRQEGQKRQLENVETRHAVEVGIARGSSAERSELRRKWTRSGL